MDILILFAAWHILYVMIRKVVERKRRKASGPNRYRLAANCVGISAL